MLGVSQFSCHYDCFDHKARDITEDQIRYNWKQTENNSNTNTCFNSSSVWIVTNSLGQLKGVWGVPDGIEW